MFWRLCALSLLGLSIWLLASSFWPLPIDNATLTVSLPNMDSEIRSNVHLQTPTRLRLGEKSLIILTISPPRGGSADKDYSLLAEANLELPGFTLSPASTQMQPFPVEKELHISWQITSQHIGETPGAVALNLHWYPQDGNTAKEYLLSAQPFTIQTGALLGLNVTLLRFLGVAGSGVGTLLLVYIARRP